EAVSEHILSPIIQSGINWIVTDEAMLFKSLRKKKRITSYLYQPWQLKRKDGMLNIVFRDRNLSDLIGFAYQGLKPEDAVWDFTNHLKNIARHFKNRNPLVVVALDGENAWEYYKNDGWDFLSLLYQQLSVTDFLKTTTVSEYLRMFPAKRNISYLKAGSWVDGNFNKWIGSDLKNKAWDYLVEARQELSGLPDGLEQSVIDLARKQISIAEGSDWFWWYGDTDDDMFDQLFRMHLSNFYSLIKKEIPAYLKVPLQ
ncbi:MAG: glycoside hydrolase, partial [Candidatus Omnitrophota bacterium]